MSNVIPPLLSDSPPPMVNVLDEDEDDFGDFTAAHDILYNYDDLSLPTTPHHVKQVETKDVNSNTSKVENYATDEIFIPNNVRMDKDFQDKRKNFDDTCKLSDTEVNSNQFLVNSVNIDGEKHLNDENSCVKLEVKIVPIDSDKIGEIIEKDVDNCTVPEISELSNNQLSSTVCNDVINTENDLNDSGTENLEQSKLENDADDFYFCEEPPDLNTVDDRKLNVEDFDYNAYNSEEEFDEIYNSVTEGDELRQETIINAIVNADIKKIDNEKLDNKNTIEINEIVVENSQKTKEVQENSQKTKEVQENSQKTKEVEENSQKTKEVEENSQITKEGIEENVDKSEEDARNIEIFNDFNAECGLHDSSIENEVTDLQNLSDSNNFSVEDDDFGDFVTPNEEIIDKFENSPTKKQELSFENKIETLNPSNDDLSVPTQTNDDDDEFGDFAEPDDDGFGDFADFKQSGFSEGESFGNFGDFTEAFDATPVTTVNAKDMLEDAEKILKEVFPAFDVEYTDYDVVECLDADVVFNRIKSITETNALQYQWAKSNSQEKLLGSLNIDTRNILYGPGWNPMMPKFAANLGVTPLEPVKSDILIPTPVHNISPNVTAPTQTVNVVGTTQTEIPTAQFDWSGSGLVNPLDYISEISCSESQSPESVDELDSWDFWLRSLPQDTQQKITDQLTTTIADQVDHPSELPTSDDRSPKQSDTESVKSLQLSTHEENATKGGDMNTANNDDFDDFSVYQPSNSWTVNNIPLRETHISSDTETKKTESETKKSDPFQTIFTLKKVETNKKVLEIDDGDDEFTDFQAGLPNNSDKDRLGVNQAVLQPVVVLEPLKPTVLPQVSQNAAPAQILWPDPGITDSDILNIDLSYSRKTSVDIPVEETKKPVEELKKLAEVKRVVPTPKNTGFSNLLKSKFVTNDFKLPMNNNFGFQNSFGDNKNIGSVDDEWSDFVCNPEPIKPVKIPEKERTNTPELRLSINHLSQLQPPKQPIPVITPQGLIQTKIPSNSNLINHQSLRQNPSTIRSYQPSIISQQYQNHINGPTFPKIPQSFPQQQKNVAKLHENIESNNDDDDWTEFVSSAPVSQNRNPRPNGWTNAVMPNIITNPVHSFNSYAPQASNRRNVVPSISSMPELEFSAPNKGRGYVKK